MHPILLKIGEFELGAYTAMAAIGGICFFALLKSREKKMGLVSPSDYWLAVNVLAFSAFAGAKLLYLVFGLFQAQAQAGPLVVSVNLGFSAFGFFAGLLAGTWFLSRKFALPFAGLADYVFAFLPVWQFFVRLGCFFRGCCYGRQAGESLPWGVKFSDPSAFLPDALRGLLLHPVQLYEAAGTAALFLLLYRALSSVESGRLKKGSVCSMYLLGYGILRFALEFFRGDTRPFFWGVTSGQAMAAGSAGLGLFFWLAMRRADPSRN